MATTLTFQISYGINEGLIINPSEFIDLYLFGIPLKDKQGHCIPMSTLENFIRTGQEEIEHYLGIKFMKQVIPESKDYILDDWKSWGYMRTTYMVNKAYEMQGFVNTVQQMNLPKEWLSTRTSQDNLKFRHIYVVPVASASLQASAIYHGVVPLGFMSNNQIPNYWKLVYTTGFDHIPMDLLNLIGKLASINIFHMLGDLILGTPGIVSKSIGIDGLSQSYSTAGGFSNRIKGYMEDIKEMLPRVYNYYRGFGIISC